MKNTKRAFTALLFSLLSFSAMAGEGFFSPGQISLPFSVSSVRPAALLVEELKSGKQSHIGNAFFVSEGGYALTNFHIARSCLAVHRRMIEQKYGTLTNLFRKGFLAETMDGISCPNLVMKNNRGESLAVTLVAFPPIAEQPDVDTPQEQNGPTYDFAILKVTLPEGARPEAWLQITAGAKEAYNEGSDVYFVGYPASTIRAENSKLIQEGKYSDVATGDYRISLGKVLPVLSDYFYQPNKDVFLYTSTDGGPGSSGSALLSGSGELIALILGSGNANSTFARGCSMRVKYCEGGVSLYLKSSHIADVLFKNYPDLARILVRP